MNTKINYLYRDAGNWKFRGSFVVGGAISPKELDPHMFDTERFVPQQVGLKHLLTESWTEDDHLLHEFEEFEETEDPNCLCTAKELIERFAKANADGWFKGIF
jgi:hypothetical protein